MKYVFIDVYNKDAKMQVTNTDQLCIQGKQSSFVDDSQYNNLLVPNKGNLKLIIY